MNDEDDGVALSRVFQAKRCYGSFPIIPNQFRKFQWISMIELSAEDVCFLSVTPTIDIYLISQMVHFWKKH